MRRAESVDGALLRRWPLPEPQSGDKDGRGSVFVVAGSVRMPGAAVLSATAALCSGAGKLTLGTVASVAPFVATAVLESLVLPLRETPSGALALCEARAVTERANASDALVLGPGMVGKLGSTAFAAAVLRALEVPVVIDAIALGAVNASGVTAACLEGRAVLTPHAGEMASLLGCDREAVEAAPAECARDVAERTHAVVVLKGGTTHIAAPGDVPYRHEYGVSGLGTSGSGDVLAGIVGGLLARGLGPLPAALWGVYLHAQAGLALTRSAGFGFLARDVAQQIPPLMRAHRDIA